MFDHGELVGVVHRVEEISDSKHAFAAMTRAVDAGNSWARAELLHTFAAVSAVENARHSERQQALVAENQQLRHAIDTRDMIGQAKGMLMERFNIDANGAFDLLVRLSQNTNTRLEQIARNLVEIDHPPCSTG